MRNVDLGNGDDKLTTNVAVAISVYVHGGSGNDTLTTGSGDDSIFGDAGLDRIAGGDGRDTVSGGADFDQIDGGSGNDTLYADDAANSDVTGHAQSLGDQS